MLCKLHVSALALASFMSMETPFQRFLCIQHKLIPQLKHAITWGS